MSWDHVLDKRQRLYLNLALSQAEGVLLCRLPPCAYSPAGYNGQGCGRGSMLAPDSESESLSSLAQMLLPDVSGHESVELPP